MNKFFEIPGLNIYIQLAVTLISISVHLLATRNKSRKESVVELMTIYTIGLAGWFSIINGIFGHILYADEVAASIGWSLNSGFQMELAFASIGIGITGFIGFWNREFWLPFIIAKSSLMLGAGYTHIVDMLEHGNFSPGNAGVVLYWDFIFPILLAALYTSYRFSR